MIDETSEVDMTPSKEQIAQYPTEFVDIASLKPHPRNYRNHPPDQLEHLAASLKEHGQYRNVVISLDDTILAGHGVIQAAAMAGLKQISAVRMPLLSSEPAAIKIVVADNEVAHMAEVNDRALTELLKEIKDTDINGLLGTGFDELQLAALVMVTRPASEIQDFDEAAEWVGMPEYAEGSDPIQLIINFRTKEDKETFCTMNELGSPYHGNGKPKTVWWPPKVNEDPASVKFLPQGAKPHAR